METYALNLSFVDEHGVHSQQWLITKEVADIVRAQLPEPNIEYLASRADVEANAGKVPGMWLHREEEL